MQAGQSEQSERRDVIRRELAWHEGESQRRRGLDSLLYDPPAFDALVEAGLSFLQARPDDLVLDLGCGEGKETVLLARRQLPVIGVDLSRQQLARARARVEAEAPGAQVHFVQASAEALPFAAASFHRVYGKAIIHHLHLDLAARELGRILHPSGRATLAEPLAHHPLFWLARRLTPRLRTADEQPLPWTHLERFAGRFAAGESEAYFLLAPAAYWLRLLPGGEGPFRRAHGWLQQIDRRLFQRLPPLRHLAWYGMVTVRASVDASLDASLEGTVQGER